MIDKREGCGAVTTPAASTGQKSPIGRQNESARMSTRSELAVRSAQMMCYGGTAVVSCRAAETHKAQMQCGPAWSVDSSPSTRVRGTQLAPEALMMLGNCTRNPTKKVVSKNDSNNFYCVEYFVWLFRQPQRTRNETGMSRIRGLEVR